MKKVLFLLLLLVFGVTFVSAYYDISYSSGNYYSSSYSSSGYSQRLVSDYSGYQVKRYSYDDDYDSRYSDRCTTRVKTYYDGRGRELGYNVYDYCEPRRYTRYYYDDYGQNSLRYDLYDYDRFRNNVAVQRYVDDYGNLVTIRNNYPRRYGGYYY